MPTQIKICGLTTAESLDTAVAAGASYIGLNLYPPSPRFVTLELAAALRRRTPPQVKIVILLVNADPLLTGEAIDAIRPDIVQFHGKETPDWLAMVRQKARIPVWKALGVRDRETLQKSDRFVGAADLLLFDAPAQALPGGTGTRFDWSLLSEHQHRIPWGLAGGLTPANVSEALRQTGAALVDVSSGVESAPGVKDVDKIRAFCKAVQDHDRASASR
jgi:phosphoribosylanthranilate isomerase